MAFDDDEQLVLAVDRSHSISKLQGNKLGHNEKPIYVEFSDHTRYIISNNQVYEITEDAVKNVDCKINAHSYITAKVCNLEEFDTQNNCFASSTAQKKNRYAEEKTEDFMLTEEFLEN